MIKFPKMFLCLLVCLCFFLTPLSVAAAGAAPNSISDCKFGVKIVKTHQVQGKTDYDIIFYRNDKSFIKYPVQIKLNAVYRNTSVVDVNYPIVLSLDPQQMSKTVFITVPGSNLRMEEPDNYMIRFPSPKVPGVKGDDCGIADQAFQLKFTYDKTKPTNTITYIFERRDGGKIDCYTKICRQLTVATRMGDNKPIWNDIIVKYQLKPNEFKSIGTFIEGWPSFPLWGFDNEPTAYDLQFTKNP